MNNWQPIETAPMDGTEFLAFGKGSESCIVERDNLSKMCLVVRWHEIEYDAEEEVGNGLYRKVKTKALGGFRSKLGFVRFEPTHWIPLPKPPQ